MKRLLPFLLAVAAFGQSYSNAPNCRLHYILSNRPQDAADSSNFGQSQIVYQLSGGAVTTAPFTNTGCGAGVWIVRYAAEGFSALSLQFESAPLTRYVVGATPINQPGTFAAFQGNITVGVNPNTATTSATTTVTGYYPYLRFNLSSSTGTGSIDVWADGYAYISQLHASNWADRIEISAGSGNLVQATVGTIFAYPVTLTRFNVFMSTASNTCATYPVLGLRDTTTSTTLTSITLANGTSSFDSGALNIPIIQGDTIVPTWITAGVTCTGLPAGIHFSAALAG